MITGYHIKNEKFRSGKTVFYDGLSKSGGRSVIIQTCDNDFPAIEDLAGLKNDYEITHNAGIPGVIKSIEIVRYLSGIALIKESFDGTTLSQYLQSTKLNIQEQFQIAIALAEILRDLHARSVVHKDLNPGNFLIDPNTRNIRLSKCMLATHFAKENIQPSPTSVLSGSLAYISPEQTGRMNRSIDYRTDFYSLGIIYYQMLCGRLPFASQNAIELVHAHIAADPANPSSLDASIPPMLSKVVLKLLAKNAEDRYQSADGLLSDLRKCESLFSNSGHIEEFEAGATDVSPAFIVPERLYGREKERQQLLGVFEKARQGPIHFIVVSGYSGIGKTRLVNEIYKPVARDNGYYAIGKYDQYNRDSPYAGIAMAFGNLVKQFLAESPMEFEHWKAKVLNAAGENGQILIDIVPEIGLLIGKQPTVFKLGLRDAQQRLFGIFSSMLKELASPAHPLVLFIDDLQWADGASLDLLFQLVNDKTIRHTLIIGSYRDNEVSAGHPLMQMFLRLRLSANGAPEHLVLQELDNEHVNQLLNDAFRQDQTQNQQLSELVIEKTRGNPYFIIQFLNTLVQQNLIYFDKKEFRWKYDSEAIGQMKIADNVVDLLVLKIQTLPMEIQNELTLAACIGHRFDLDTLTSISKKEFEEVANAMWEAVSIGLLQPLQQRSRYFDAGSFWKEMGITTTHEAFTAFQFQHDRIQQAAYSLIPEEYRPETHLNIARILYEKLEAASKETLFEVANHYNLGQKLVNTEEEQIKVARLNLQAGEMARDANAYQSSLTYLRTAMAGIKPAMSKALYENILIARSESEYLCGHFDESEKMFDIALGLAVSSVSKARVLARKMKLYESTSRQKEAIRIALDGLRLLGTDLSEFPGKVSILTELMKAKLQLRGKTVDELKLLPNLQSEALELTMQIMMNMWGPAYLHNQNLLVKIILRMVIISAKHGNAPASALAYTFYGFVCCAQLKDFEGGYRFAELGLWLNEKFEDKQLRSKVYVIFAGCVAHWRKDYAFTLDWLRQANEVGIESNDLIYAGYAFNFISNNLYLKGDPLPSVYEACVSMLRFGRDIHHLTTIHHLVTRTRVVTQLAGIPLEGAIFEGLADLENHETQLMAFASQEGIALPWTEHCINQAEFYYLTGEYERALDYRLKAEKTIVSLTGLAGNINYNFIYSMVLMALAKAGKRPLADVRRQVAKNQKDLALWAKNAPANFMGKYLLAEAELKSLDQDFMTVMNACKKALGAAEQAGIIQVIALVQERMAVYCASKDMVDLALIWFRKSTDSYRQWGALVKVRQLSDTITALASGTNILVGTGYANANIASAPDQSETTIGALDLQSIFKASVTISGEVVFDSLLEKLLHILMENAGARKACLFLVKGQQLVAVARGNVALSMQVEVMKEIPLEQLADFPRSVIQFVLNTRETVIKGKASLDERFARDPYLLASNPKSMLCQPVIQHGKCLAIIYLEHDLAFDVFTPARLQVLNLLSGQIAVSLENANLYNQQSLLNKAYQRFVPVDFLQELGHQSILNVKLGDSIDKEMTILFCDIRSYTAMSESLTPKGSFELINQYLSYVGPVIKNHGGFINHYLGDGFIALFKEGPVSAIEAALQVNKAMQVLNTERKAQGVMPIEVGMGLHSGRVMMGIIGDTDRHDANVMSDAVNVASRLEGLTKLFGANIVISQKVLAGLPANTNFYIRSLGRVKLKGKESVIDVHEVFNTEEGVLLDQKLMTVTLYNQGLQQYFAQNFTEAIALLRQVLAINPDDRSAGRYLKNAQRYLENGIHQGWDGVEQMIEK